MKQMVMLIMTNPDQSMELLEAWDRAGAPGITILESIGLQTIRQFGVQDDLPLMPSLADIFRSKEKHHRTMFSVVDDEAAAQQLLDATARIFADYDARGKDNSAVAFVLPVAHSQSFITARARARVDRNRK